MVFLEVFILITGFISILIFGVMIYRTIGLIKIWNVFEHTMDFARRITLPYFFMGLLSTIIGVTFCIREVGPTDWKFGLLYSFIGLIVFFLYMGVLYKLDRVVRGLSNDAGWVSKLLAVLIFVYLLGNSGFSIFGVVWFFINGYVDSELIMMGYVIAMGFLIGLHWGVVQLRVAFYRLRRDRY